MATLRAVVEIGPEGVDGAPWPIETADDYRWTVLDGSTPPATIGTVMAALAEWCRPDEADIDETPSVREALCWIAESDYLVIRAGIQATDASTTVNPGCCADLEGWRTWPDMWLGHDPTPQVEQTAGGLLIRQESGSQDFVKLGDLPGLLSGVRDDLIAFLGAVERWAKTTGADPELAAAVVATIDRHVVITAPLEGAGGRR